jgi:hypothetical protein
MEVLIEPDDILRDLTCQTEVEMTYFKYLQTCQGSTFESPKPVQGKGMKGLRLTAETMRKSELDLMEDPLELCQICNDGLSTEDNLIVFCEVSHRFNF